MSTIIKTGWKHPAVAWLFVGALVAALHPTDTPAYCGDGRLEPGEDCDGSYFRGTPTPTCMSELGISCGSLACNSYSVDRDCTIALQWSCGATCGDGCRRDPEECDSGSANSDVAPNACRTWCVLPFCGDWTVDTGEQCDDGPGNDDELPDACREDCTRARCGDGTRDGSEACDLGPLNGAPGSECSATCALAGCGTGTLDPTETCDDGNTDNDDGCLGTCVPNVCGDGFTNLDVDPSTLLIAEVCDPSFLDPFGNCRYDCGQRLLLCGNGDVDPGEECDAGTANADLPNAACRTDCQLPRCGDGVVDDAAATPEECDRGPGCGADCRLRP
jgi:cysteine-rich repeat protein